MDKEQFKKIVSEGQLETKPAKKRIIPWGKIRFAWLLLAVVTVAYKLFLE